MQSKNYDHLSGEQIDPPPQLNYIKIQSRICLCVFSSSIVFFLEAIQRTHPRVLPLGTYSEVSSSIRYLSGYRWWGLSRGLSTFGRCLGRFTDLHPGHFSRDHDGSWALLNLGGPTIKGDSLLLRSDSKVFLGGRGFCSLCPFCAVFLGRTIFILRRTGGLQLSINLLLTGSAYCQLSLAFLDGMLQSEDGCPQGTQPEF